MLWRSHSHPLFLHWPPGHLRWNGCSNQFFFLTYEPFSHFWDSQKHKLSWRLRSKSETDEHDGWRTLAFFHQIEETDKIKSCPTFLFLLSMKPFHSDIHQSREERIITISILFYFFWSCWHKSVSLVVAQ